VTVGYERLTRAALSPDDLAELADVDALAQRLLAHLEGSEAAIDVAHVHAAPSGAIQAIASAVLTEALGFKEEIVLAPEEGFTIRARPDFIYRLAPGRGVLAEVERGGTTTNNHDLKDFWKAHIAQDAHHLFLIVPRSNWKRDGTGREKPYKHVCRRLRAFFGDARREVDVLSVHIFGYGREM
jgi:hypothetical protein